MAENQEDGETESVKQQIKNALKTTKYDQSIKEISEIVTPHRDTVIKNLEVMKANDEVIETRTVQRARMFNDPKLHKAIKDADAERQED